MLVSGNHSTVKMKYLAWVAKILLSQGYCMEVAMKGLLDLT